MLLISPYIISSTEFNFFHVLWNIFFQADDGISRKPSLTAVFKSATVRKRRWGMLHFTIPQSELSQVVKFGLRGSLTMSETRKINRSLYSLFKNSLNVKKRYNIKYTVANELCFHPVK